MTNAAIVAVSDTMTNDIVAFRKAGVAASGKQTPFARSVLASLVSGAFTASLVEAAIVRSFGNPNSPNGKGKPVATVSGLRPFPGGTIVYQAWKDIVKLHADIDSDKDSGGAIRKLVEGFILSEKGAPLTLFALVAAYKEALKAHAATLVPDDAADDAAADNAANDAANAANVADSVSLVERATLLLVAYQAASSEERDAAYEAIALLFDAVNADTKEAVEAGEAVLEAA